MSKNKLVIRRLPPSMSEDEFLKQISPLPDHDYFCFFEPTPGLGLHSFSRAYINFLNSEDMFIFRERFDNYTFLDRDGHEYPAVVEQAFWHKSSKSGPFHVTSNSDWKNEEEQAVPKSETVATDITDDPDFLEFIQKTRSHKKGSQQPSIQTLENNLDELTNASNSNIATHKDNQLKPVTPLIGYVNQKRLLKNKQALCL